MGGNRRLRKGASCSVEFSHAGCSKELTFHGIRQVSPYRFHSCIEGSYNFITHFRDRQSFEHQKYVIYFAITSSLVDMLVVIFEGEGRRRTNSSA